MSQAIQYDLNTGYPDLDLVPRNTLSELAQELFTRDRPLQYVGDMRGDRWTREQVAAWLSTQTAQPLTLQELQITGGAISATDQVCRYVTRPNDIVLVENPTFYYIIHKLELSHVQVMGVPMQPDGIDLDALEAICQQYGERVKMLYAIPTFHNPTGYIYSDEKRRKLVELAQRYNFTVLEDATYQTLYYADAPPPMLREYDTSGRVITVGSFAKLIMPSLRIGWIWATPAQVDALIPYKTTATSVFMSQLVGEMIHTGAIVDQTAHARRLYGGKHQRMQDALHAHAPAWLSWSKPYGGYFVWLTLPEGLHVSDVHAAAHAVGIDFAEGKRAFVRGDAPDRFMRLCFALLDDDQITAGTRALCEVLSRF